MPRILIKDLRNDIQCIAETVKGGRCKRRCVKIAGKRRPWCRQHWEQLHRLKQREKELDHAISRLD